MNQLELQGALIGQQSRLGVHVAVRVRRNERVNACAFEMLDMGFSFVPCCTPEETQRSQQSPRQYCAACCKLRWLSAHRQRVLPMCKRSYDA